MDENPLPRRSEEEKKTGEEPEEEEQEEEEEAHPSLHTGRALAVRRRRRGTIESHTLGLYHMHIPKTAGISFVDAMETALQEFMKKPRIASQEYCYGKWMNYMKRPQDRLITLLRSPVAHVQSQYYECVDTGFGRKHTRPFLEDEKSPARSALVNFSTWIRYFQKEVDERPGKIRDFDCYTPYNMQTRYFTCIGGWDDGHHVSKRYVEWNQTHTPLKRALKNMNSRTDIGLTEYYQESICAFVINFTKRVPSYCNCANPEAWAAFQTDHTAHGVRPHAISDISAADLEVVRDLTKFDAHLYAAAESKFTDYLLGLEAEYGIKLSCRGLPGQPAAGSKAPSRSRGPVASLVVASGVAASGTLDLFTANPFQAELQRLLWMPLFFFLLVLSAFWFLRFRYAKYRSYGVLN